MQTTCSGFDGSLALATTHKACGALGVLRSARLSTRLRMDLSCGHTARGKKTIPHCCCHGLYFPVPAQPCRCTGPYIPLAHEVAVFGSCGRISAWSVVRGVDPPAPNRVYVGTHLPAWLVLRPFVVAL